MARTSLFLAFLCLFIPATGPATELSPADNPEKQQINARFAPCSSGQRITCIVDGDTFWIKGTKIRIADINTPEVSHAKCPAERQLGTRATARLLDLLNRGPFTLEMMGRDEDRYGRKLRIVTRDGKSLGQMLVNEGLAEPWTGRRKNWC